MFTTLLGLVLLALVLRVSYAVARHGFRARPYAPAGYVDFPTDDEVIGAIKTVPGHFATGVTTEKIGSRNAISIYAHKPNATTAQVLTPDQQTTRIWKDMRDYGWFAAIACNHTLTGNGLTLLEIVAAEDNTGTNLQVVLASAVLTGTAVDNGAFLEVSAAQVREVAAASGKNLRYVSARLTVANSADTCAVALVLADARHPQDKLTPLTF